MDKQFPNSTFFNSVSAFSVLPKNAVGQCWLTVPLAPGLKRGIDGKASHCKYWSSLRIVLLLSNYHLDMTEILLTKM